MKPGARTMVPRPGSNHLEVLFELGFDLGLWLCPDDLGNDLTTFEDEESGDRTNAVLLWHPYVVVNVDLANFDLTFVLGGQSIHRGCNLLTWPTPRSPKVDKGGHFRIENLSFKAGISEFKDVFASHISIDSHPQAISQEQLGISTDSAIRSSHLWTDFAPMTQAFQFRARNGFGGLRVPIG